MRVVVVGVLDKQAASIAGQYPSLRLKFTGKRKRLNRSDRALLNSADRVLLMTKFVSHAQNDAIDAAKCSPVNGGMSGLRQQLGTLNALAAMEAKAAAPARKPAVAPPVEPRPTPAAVVAAPATIYMQEPVMKKESQKLDLAPLRKTAVGEEYVVNRPPGLAESTFRGRLSVGRSYFRRQYGIETSISISRDAARIRVEANPQISRVEAPSPAAVPTAAPDSRTSDRPPTGFLADDAAQVSVRPHIQVASFWTSVFLQAQLQRPAASAVDLTAFANEAVAGLVAAVSQHTSGSRS